MFKLGLDGIRLRVKQTSREERPQIEIKRNAKLSTEGMKRESEKGNIQMTI